MSDFKEIDHVDVPGDNPDWILRVEKSIKDDEEVGFRFIWIHNGKIYDKMNTFLPTPILFTGIAAAVKKGMIT